MDNVEKIKYLNDFFNKKESFKYYGPKTLFKYRAFDKFTFDMFENDYVYLCPAEKLDDPTECDVSFDIQDIYDIDNDGLKRKCIDKLTEQLRPFTTSENYEKAQSIINSTLNRDGTVRPNFMLDAYFDLQSLVPETDIAPFINWIVDIPNRVNDPKIKPQIEKLFAIGYNAKKETGICSLAESNDVSDMWENYASNSSGYCIEYDVSDYEFNCGIFPVVYQDDRQTNIIEQIVYNFIGELIFGLSDGQVDADKSQFLRLFLTKNLKWDYQKEWRLLGDAGQKIKAPKIKTIYIGKNASADDRQKMQEYCDRHNIALMVKE